MSAKRSFVYSQSAFLGMVHKDPNLTLIFGGQKIPEGKKNVVINSPLCDKVTFVKRRGKIINILQPTRLQIDEYFSS